jgi:hypothetical protein
MSRRSLRVDHGRAPVHWSVQWSDVSTLDSVPRLDIHRPGVPCLWQTENRFPESASSQTSHINCHLIVKLYPLILRFVGSGMIVNFVKNNGAIGLAVPRSDPEAQSESPTEKDSKNHQSFQSYLTVCQFDIRVKAMNSSPWSSHMRVHKYLHRPFLFLKNGLCMSRGFGRLLNCSRITNGSPTLDRKIGGKS